MSTSLRATMLAVIEPLKAGTKPHRTLARVYNKVTNNYVDGSFCLPCANRKAKRSRKPLAVENCGDDGADDSIVHCQRCYARCTGELTGYGAREDLDHWEGDLPSAKLDSSEKWLEFSLCVAAIPDEQLPRLVVVMRKNGVEVGR